MRAALRAGVTSAALAAGLATSETSVEIEWTGCWAQASGGFGA